MIDLGVKGFILKTADAKEYENAINSVYSGGVYFSAELMKFLSRRGEPRHQSNELQSLSKREKDVLKLICAGLNNNEISEKLFISVRTVEKHKTNIFIKTGVDSTQKLIVYAAKNFQIENPHI
jgi:DNA-binding NarL/FixJ family response regulator